MRRHRARQGRRCCRLTTGVVVMGGGLLLRGGGGGGVVAVAACNSSEFPHVCNATCDWIPACGSEINVDPSGQGCVNPALGNVSRCTVCNYVYNSPPCDNTAENVYNHREALYAGTPHFNDICGGPGGGDAASGDPWNDPAIECGPICAISGRPAFSSITLLDTCYRYSEKSCCYVIQDTEIADAYFTLLEAGDRCKDELIYPKLRLRDAFCMACDPNQGKYLVEGTLNVCESLATTIQPWKFDACGLLMVEERGMPWYGDDTVIPSEAWPDVTDFLNDVVGAHPPYLEDYEVQVIDNCEPACQKTDGAACTIYDPEYLACHEIRANLSTPCYDPDHTESSAASVSVSGALSALGAAVVLSGAWT